MKFLIILILPIYLFSGVVRVAVAANVSYALPDLQKAFNKIHPQIKLQVVLGGSGSLSAQILHGAPFDLFLSANMQYPQNLYKEGIAINKPIVYAKGALALFTIKDIDLNRSLEVLKSSKIEKIAVANPKSAPYGAAAIEALKGAKLLDTLKEKFIYSESVSGTVMYALTAADAAFVAKSSLFSPKMKRFKKGKNWIEVDCKLYSPIKQGMVLLKRAKENKEAKAFYDFLLSSKAKDIFRRYGYSVDE